MTTTILIPTRIGSKRLPQKPIIMIGAKPLIERVYDCAALSGFKTMVCCPVEDEGIWRHMSHQGTDVIVSERGKTVRNGTERCAQAVIISPPFKGMSMDDIIINVQGDNGWLVPELLPYLEKWYRSVLELEGRPFVLGTMDYELTEEERDNPHIVKVIQQEGRVFVFVRQMLAPKIGEEVTAHAGIYIYNIRTLVWYAGFLPCKEENELGLEQMRFLHPPNHTPVPVHSLRINREDAPIAVNTADDLQPLIDKYAEVETWSEKEIKEYQVTATKVEHDNPNPLVACDTCGGEYVQGAMCPGCFGK